MHRTTNSICQCTQQILLQAHITTPLSDQKQHPRATNHEPRTVSHELQATNYEPRTTTTNHDHEPTNHELRATSHDPWITSNEPRTTTTNPTLSSSRLTLLKAGREELEVQTGRDVSVEFNVRNASSPWSQNVLEIHSLTFRLVGLGVNDDKACERKGDKG